MCSSLFNLDHEDGQLNYRSLGAVFLGLLLHFMPAGPCKCLWMCLGHALEVEVGEGGGICVGGMMIGWRPVSGGLVSDD